MYLELYTVITEYTNESIFLNILLVFFEISYWDLRNLMVAYLLWASLALTITAHALCYNFISLPIMHYL